MQTVTASICLAQEGDATVMLYLGCGSPEERRAAWAEFYRRHAKFLYRCVVRWCRTNGAALFDYDWLFHQAVLRVYEKADTYEAQCDGRPDEEKANLRAWLGRIVENLLKTQLREREPTISLCLLEELDEEPFVVPWHEVEDDPVSPQMRLIVKALESLTEREQDVLRRVWMEKDWRNPEVRLAANVTKQIADSLGTTPTNLRQIFHRAMEKMKKFVAANVSTGEPCHD